MGPAVSLRCRSEADLAAAREGQIEAKVGRDAAERQKLEAILQRDDALQRQAEEVLI